MKPYRRLRRWQSDSDYLRDQDGDNSWSHLNLCGEAPAARFIAYGHSLAGRLFHDDIVADFGGNDGYASYRFWEIHKIKPIVVDCEPKRIDYAMRVFKMPTCETFIEKMPFTDRYVRFGFCSHTIEHTREPERALSELRRVIVEECCFVLPIEGERIGKGNHAHSICIPRMSGWVRFLKANGWRPELDRMSHHDECTIVARPT